MINKTTCARIMAYIYFILNLTYKPCMQPQLDQARHVLMNLVHMCTCVDTRITIRPIVT